MLKSYNPVIVLADDDTLLAYKTVICDQVGRCRKDEYCGGAQAHMYQPEECGKCLFNENARCLPVEKSYDEIKRQSEILMEVAVRSGLPIMTY